MLNINVRCKNALGLFPSGNTPGQVVNVHATDIRATFVDLAWDPTFNAANYIVYVDGQPFTSSPTTSVRVLGIDPATTYTMAVQAVNGEELGLISSSIIVTTPPVPAWLSSFHIRFELGVASTFPLSAVISPPSSLGTYTVQAGVLPPGVTLNSGNGNLSYNGVGGLSAIAAITFRFSNGVDPPADTTNSDIATVDTTVPQQVTGLVASNITSSGFTLTWNAVADFGLIGYRIYRNSVLFVDTANKQTSRSITGQTASSTNAWRVEAYDSVRAGPQSNILNVTQSPDVFTWTGNTPSFLPVVPGGAGFGMDTPGGSGRDSIVGGLAAPTTVIPITNYNLSGAGSGKGAFLTAGRRIILPLVNGTVNYQGQAETGTGANSRLFVMPDGFCSYWGAVGPGPGLIFRAVKLICGIGTSDYHLDTLIILQDVFSTEANADTSGDCIGTQSNVSKVVHSNCAYSFASDEMTDWNNGMLDGTFYQCYMAEAINIFTNHGYGPIVGSTPNGRVSFIRNFMAHNVDRQPLTRARNSSIVNNVVYNWSGRAIHINSHVEADPTDVNIEGNVFITGPSLIAGRKPVFVAISDISSTPAVPVTVRYYLNGNLSLGFADSPQSILVTASGLGTATQLGSRVSASHPGGLSVTLNADEVVLARLVMRWCGPRPLVRHSFFQRVINHCEARITGIGSQGGIIATPADAGGFPNFPQSTVDIFAGGDPPPGLTSPLTGPQSLGTAGRTIMPSGYTAFEEWYHRRRATVMPTA